MNVLSMVLSTSAQKPGNFERAKLNAPRFKASFAPGCVISILEIIDKNMYKYLA